MMDEQLIDEVAQHGVIYNRQKYYLNGSTNGGKYETKDEAWQLIAMKLRTDVDTCKKRWKYLRERYVSQRKQGDPPVYEHLSRPYLEKMKFLDQHIQPRKSYRHVPNFLTSPQSANSSSYNEYQALDKSNGSNGMKNVSQFGGGGSGQGHHYHQPDQQQQHPMSALSTAAASALETVNGQVKIEADQVFRDFAAAVASQQLQQISQSQMQQQAAAVAAVMADSSQGYQEQYKDSSVGVPGVQNSGGSLTSTSSSMKSPLSSPLQVIGAGSLHSQQQHQHQQQQQSQQPQQSPASGGQQLPVVHSSSSAAGSTSSNMQQMQQQQQSHVYNPKGSDDLDSSSTSGNFHMKKPRVQINGHNQMTSNGGGNGGHFGNDSDDDSDDNSHDLMEPQVMMHESHYSNSMGMQRGNNNSNNGGSSNNSGNGGSNNQQQQQQQQQHQQQQQQQHQNMFPSNTDFLFQLYQQFPHQASGSHPSNFGKFQTPPNQPGVQRLSEHLLGELVTSELLKMNKERKKSAQKRILEILFFDD